VKFPLTVKLSPYGASPPQQDDVECILDADGVDVVRNNCGCCGHVLELDHANALTAELNALAASKAVL
jgi:hypothetical protein